jgi:hypothetical protein
MDIKVTKKKKKYKRLIQIKTNTSGWKTVELIKFLRGNRMLIRLPTGEIIRRKNKNVRLSIVKKYTGDFL